MFEICFGPKTEPHKIFSVPVSDAKSGEGQVRRHPLVGNTELCAVADPNIQTLYELLEKSSSKYEARPFLGTRSKIKGSPGPYTWNTYGEVWTRVEHFSSGLMARGLDPDKNIGLFSVNRLEWVVAEYACYRARLITVPLYDTLGTEAIVHICNSTEMSHVVASKDKAIIILRNATSLPYLKTIIVMDPDLQEVKNQAQSNKIQIVEFSEIEEMGKAAKQSPRPPKPSNLCTICYTSGTTGVPKGVMITHSNVIAVLAALDLLIKNQRFYAVGPDDVHLSYLPLPHIFERIIMSLFIQQGASVGFYQGDTLKILDDVMELQPTIFASVPRLFNRIYDRVRAGLQKGAKLSFLNGKTLMEYVFDWAYQAKARQLSKGKVDHWLWDRLIFSKIRAKLGGNVRGMLAGSAPISGDVLDFLRICFSCQVYEGYGQTEATAGTCLTETGDWTDNHVGGPFPCNEIKLVDVPELDYYAAGEHPCGEVLIRGPNCFVGYYKDPKQTQEVIDKDGWVHSGDIGTWDGCGRLRIVDRKKNIFKLSQGEYVAPEKIENVLVKHILVDQIFIEGNSLESSVVAVVVPNAVQVSVWARKTLQLLDKDPQVVLEQANAEHAETLKKWILGELTSYARAEKLRGFEIPKDIHVSLEPFSVGNGLLTPSHKLRRNVAAKRFERQIHDIYLRLRK